MDERVERLRTLGDPVERARAATDLMAAYSSAITELSRLRRESIEELRAYMSQAQVAAALGLTRSRVGQLEVSGPPPERAFLGVDQLTIAIALKEEAGKAQPSPVVAQEDFNAAMMLKELAAGMKLDAVFEHIAPPGMVHLNRSDLIVICGPRLSPLIAQVLESDSNLRFDRDEQGWHLIDTTAGTVHRSPMETGHPGDVAYFGRLPRPDGRGNFLYIAGVHAMGSSGVVHWLTSHIGEIYRDVRDRRFSMLIACDFDPETREVVESRRVSDIYRHDG